MELHSSCLLPLHRVVLEMAAASAVEESFWRFQMKIDFIFEIFSE
jgi:hypothetical protein